MPSSEFDRDLDVERAAGAANREKVERRLSNEDSSWDWVEAEDYVDTALLKASDLADLIVLNNDTAGQLVRDVHSVAGKIAVKSGKPVLAVPSQAGGFDAAGSALVAWDGSAGATTALRAAVPLLQLADSVTVYEIDDGSIASPAEDAAAYLSRHRVHAEILRDTARSGKVADLLLDRAKSGSYSYIVMGAYSRAQILETVFGGVTRRLLKDSPIPLILGH
jgi:nucleotide-binding universal stress UspA family protein